MHLRSRDLLEVKEKVGTVKKSVPYCRVLCKALQAALERMLRLGSDDNAPLMLVVLLQRGAPKPTSESLLQWTSRSMGIRGEFHTC